MTIRTIAMMKKDWFLFFSVGLEGRSGEDPESLEHGLSGGPHKFLFPAMSTKQERFCFYIRTPIVYQTFADVLELFV